MAQSSKLDLPSAYTGALRRFFQKRAPICDVDDLVQEVLLRMQARQCSEQIDNIEGYLFTVAARVLHQRRASPAGRAIHIDVGEIDLPDPVTPERLLLGRRELNLVTIAIERLPDRTRQIFVAHRFEDMTYTAIGRAHGISVSAVEKHIMAALRALGAAIGRER